MRSPGIPVEADLALVTLPAIGVVQTVAHTSAALSGLTPRRPIEMAALGMTIALAFWCGMKEISISGTERLRPGLSVCVCARVEPVTTPLGLLSPQKP